MQCFVLLGICTVKYLHSKPVKVMVFWSVQSAVEVVYYVLKLVPHSICTCLLLLAATLRCFHGKFSAVQSKCEGLNTRCSAAWTRRDSYEFSFSTSAKRYGSFWPLFLFFSWICLPTKNAFVVYFPSPNWNCILSTIDFSLNLLSKHVLSVLLHTL